jgi:uncharacterized protein
MYRSLSPAVFLVDGYNIIGTWSCLKKTRDNSGLEAARYELVEALTSFCAFQDYDAHLVFDAHYQNTPSNREVITEHLSVHYTDFGQTADTFIEKLCADLRQQLALAVISRVIVATSDRTQQLVVQGYGAEYISAQQLNSRIEATIHQTKLKSKSKKQPQGRFLANSIDAKARQRLAELRMGTK